MKQNLGTIIATVVLLLAGTYVLVTEAHKDDPIADTAELESSTTLPESSVVPERLQNSALNVDYSQSTVELDLVLSGGPGKDGIPALTNPEFEPIEESIVAEDTQVIVVENEGEVKVYPYSILVWHEIVNDTVGGKPLAITFCPLCGSAIVFDREIDGGVVDFGVSGFLYESNLLMYSREDNESLWSQSLGQAVVGERAGEELVYLPLQLMTFAEAVVEYPNATVLSANTGFTRDYTGNPYAGYEDTEETSFPVSVNDNRFPAKEVFYIVPVGGTSVAVRLDKADGIYQLPDSDVFVTVDKGRYTASWGDAELPGYYEMWFSWATHNQETGEVL